MSATDTQETQEEERSERKKDRLKLNSEEEGGKGVRKQSNATCPFEPFSRTFYCFKNLLNCQVNTIHKGKMWIYYRNTAQLTMFEKMLLTHELVQVSRLSKMAPSPVFELFFLFSF